MDDVVTAYVADSAASAPAPRGLPLSVQAPSRHSSVAAGTRAPDASSTDAGSAEDWDEAAAPVSPSSDASAGGDDDGPPLEELEAQMHGDVSAQVSPEAARAVRRAPRGSGEAGDNDDDDSRAPTGPLPELDELVARLPAEVRETLDELFRARFVSVKKLPRRVFTSVAQDK